MRLWQPPMIAPHNRIRTLGAGPDKFAPSTYRRPITSAARDARESSEGVRLTDTSTSAPHGRPAFIPRKREEEHGNGNVRPTAPVRVSKSALDLTSNSLWECPECQSVVFGSRRRPVELHGETRECPCGAEIELEAPEEAREL